jgi:hypothetical protein
VPEGTLTIMTTRSEIRTFSVENVTAGRTFCEAAFAMSEPILRTFSLTSPGTLPSSATPISSKPPTPFANAASSAPTDLAFVTSSLN